MKLVTYSCPRALCLVAAGLCFLQSSARAQNTWNGLGGTTNWSTPANWSFNAAPITSDTLLFDNTASVGAGVVDNIVDSDFTVTAFNYRAVSTNGFHTTLIPLGVTLRIEGNGGNAIDVGAGFALNNETVTSRFVGGGSLIVTNLTGAIYMVQGGANADHRATLDLSGLTNFTTSLSQILIGCVDNTTLGERPMAAMLLADTNVIVTAAGTTQPGIMVAAYPTGSTNLRGTQQMFLGRHNIFNCDAFSIGGHKSTAQVLFRTGLTGGFASFRGSAGGSDRVKLFTVGDQRAGMVAYDRGGTSVSHTGTFDGSRGSIDALITDLFVGRSQTNNSGVTTGAFTFEQGTIDADNVFVAYHPSPSAPATAFNAVGTLTLNGTATLTVNNDLVLARKAGTNNPNATVTVSTNATLNVKGDITTGGGISTLNLNGGTVNMQPSGDGTPGNVTIGTLSGAGSINNAANVTNTALTAPGTSSTAGTLSIGGNLALPTGSTMTMNLANVTTVGANVNDLVSVSGNLTLNSNVVTFIPTGPTLAAGSYRLFDHVGARTGFLSFTNPTRYVASLAYPANQVNLTIGGGAPANVRWNSTTSGAWDLTTSNWFNTSVSDKFFQLDTVLFDDSGAFQTNVALSTVLFPGSVTVNSSSRNYALGGSGRISGGASLVKQGTSMLSVSNANDFTGPVTISAGTLRTVNATALGTTNGGTTVSSGATLDLFGSSLFNPGEFVTIAGNGAGGIGAVINSGADQNNAIRYLALSADASIASFNPGRWDIRGPGGSGSFSGGLFLNGFTLTKNGPGKNSIVDLIATDSGNIVVSGGTLGLTRSILDGPGMVNIVGTNIIHIENNTTGYVAKPLLFSGGASTILVTGNAFTLFSAVTNTGTMVIDAQVGLTLTNVMSGAGSLNKISAGTLTLLAPDLRTGPTTISAGALVLGTNATLASTPNIAVGSGATFDVTAISGGFSLASGQTLSGSGSVVGNVNGGAASGIVPGTSAGTLTFSNNLSLNNSSNTFELNSDPNIVGGGVNDLVLVNGNLTLGGLNTIKIIPLASLNNSAPYTLFQYVGSLGGGAGNLSLSSDSRYAFTLVDPGTTPGVIKVNVSGSGASANLLWKGGAGGNPNAWDTKVTTNWLNGATPDIFFLGDNVTFDNTAATTSVTPVGTVRPAAMVINSGNYTFGGSGSVLAGAFTNNGGTSAFSNSGQNSFASGFEINAGTVTLQNNAANSFASGGQVNSTGTLNLFNMGPDTFDQPLSINGGSVVFNQLTDTIFSSQLADDGVTFGSVQKQGGNILTLSGNNSNYNGTITVSSGILRAGNNNALGTSNGGTTVASGATLDIAGFSLYNPGDIITIAGTGLNNTGAVINSGAAQNNAVRGLTLSGNAMVAAWGNRWDVRGPGGSGSLSGLLDLNGNLLTKMGAGQVSIVDADVPSAGSIDIAGGLMSFTRCNVSGAGTINVNANVLLLENYSSGSMNKPLIFSGGTLRITGNAFSLDSPITNMAPGLTADCAVALTANGTISGPGNLTKIGTSSFIVNATDSTWAGSTMIGAGTLQIGTAGVADGNLPDLPMTNNGTLLMSSSSTFTHNNHISGTGGITQSGTGTLNLTGSNSFNGQVLVSGGTGASVSGAIRISHNDALGTTTNNTRIGGDVAGGGRLELVNNITVAEPITVDCRQGATFDAPAILNVSGSNTLTADISGTTGGSQWNFQSDSGKLTIAGNFISLPTSTTRQLKLLGAAFGEWSGTIANQSNNASITAVVKSNAGSWTLSGSNTYSGHTRVSEGTLVLAASGSIAASSPIVVQSSGTFNVAAVPGGFVLGASQVLEGSGTIIGSVTANGTVAPGESIGTLTFANNLVLAGTNIMELDRLSTPNADLIVAAGLTYGGTLIVTNAGDPPQAGDTFNLFDGSISGSFAAINLPPLGPGLSWDTTQLAVNGTIKVGSVPVFGAPVLSGTTLTLSGTGGPANGTYRVLASTNVALPLNFWTSLVTNNFDGSGNFNFNISTIGFPQRFFLIRVP